MNAIKDPFGEGMNAYVNCKRLQDNPYRFESVEFEQWFAGFEQAESEDDSDLDDEGEEDGS